MMKEVRLGCKIISFGFMILLDYLFIFKVTGLTEVHELISLHYQLLSYQGNQMQCCIGQQIWSFVDIFTK